MDGNKNVQYIIMNHTVSYMIILYQTLPKPFHVHHQGAKGSDWKGWDMCWFAMVNSSPVPKNTMMGLDLV